ncbi:hypothetical protein AVEN_107082-1 [Araneus ventricosus]|uniref:Uncharacterized protein n=1 Tax=Araneus ventricosus TaxID=182803 RepID=A0A4Y2P4T2_ARAVE|nr:hypothetical protein AVEN_107082-1 [Araneus ventricosus]
MEVVGTVLRSSYNLFNKRAEILTTYNNSLPFDSFHYVMIVLDDIRSDSEDGDTLPHQDESRSDFSVDEVPQQFSQSELNNLVRNLGLSEDGAELASVKTEK